MIKKHFTKPTILLLAILMTISIPLTALAAPQLNNFPEDIYLELNLEDGQLLNQGEQFQIEWALHPINTNIIGDVIFESSNPYIFEVDSYGVITPVGLPFPGLSATLTVTVPTEFGNISRDVVLYVIHILI